MQCALKFVINTSSFDEEPRGCAFHILLTIILMSVSLDQYHGEIGSFYNQSTSQSISLFNILVYFTKNVFVYIIYIIVNMISFTVLDQFSSGNIILMEFYDTFHFTLGPIFFQNFSFKDVQWNA